APELRAVLVRTVVFVSCASALWALLPLLASRELGMGALGYGVLLGGLGAGAIVGAFVMQKARRALSTDALVGCGTLLFAAATAAVAYFQAFAPLCAAMVFGGVAWMTTMSCFNIGVQTVVPEWVRARALAVYLLSFFGTMAAGSAVWGLVAERAGVPLALLCAACGLVFGLAAALLFPLRASERLDLNPSLHWSEPNFVSEIQPEQGPVLVTVEYLIDPERADEFADAMRDFERILRRDGATRWGLFADPARPGRYLETFLVESWAEHLRQHARVTNEDRAVNERARSFHLGDAPPVVTHLIAEDTSRRGRRRALEALSQLVSRR
ncbi:MAG: MFS transporter, partial [Acidobacteriota bacterium]|nr:MFS transporter [Acidobacteriota bacterium]